MRYLDMILRGRDELTGEADIMAEMMAIGKERRRLCMCDVMNGREE